MTDLLRAAVIGDPVKHSRSPLIHGHWLKLHGIAGRYDAIHVPAGRAPAFFEGLATSGLAGCNVTVPHKEDAFRAMDFRTATAEAIGAVNTVWLEDGRLHGDNTDAYGFLANLDGFVEFVSQGHFDQIGHHRAGELIAEGHAAKLLNIRSTLLTLAGGDAMPSAAISKLLSMRTGQGYAEFAVSSFGIDGAIGDPDSPQGKWADYLLASRATTIYGGTSEVQLNIIAERLLGLPRDP